MNNNDGDQMSEEERKTSKFIQLLLNMMLRGFDEMEMQKRIEIVELFGYTIQHGFMKDCAWMKDFEKRIEALEKHCNLEINYKKK